MLSGALGGVTSFLRDVLHLLHSFLSGGLHPLCDLVGGILRLDDQLVTSGTHYLMFLLRLRDRQGDDCPDGERRRSHRQRIIV